MAPSATRRGNDEYDDPILSKAVKAGRRTYFFDVRTTRGDDCFLTITESRKMVDDSGTITYDRHKIFLYKEDFDKFAETFQEMVGYIKANCPASEETDGNDSTGNGRYTSDVTFDEL